MMATAEQLRARNPRAIKQIEKTKGIKTSQSNLVASFLARVLIDDLTYGKPYRTYKVV